ncbi:putative DNA replication licensing factor mcm4 [Paratrimastix pyriformis]|uniref:DNA helicase n=1 Tax=Paratrimastix pyriformis TaxID=342808 RepID=A0ABQ8UY60_9EUKA|nr:putative DNA replication licensing factor mcm4 [Paratrimastix pyriformis]
MTPSLLPLCINNAHIHHRVHRIHHPIHLAIALSVPIACLCSAQPRRLSARQRTLMALYSSYIQVLHVQKNSGGRMKLQGPENQAEYMAPEGGECNVLLVGDPGTSKSQLLKYVNHIAPRGIYTSGKVRSVAVLAALVVPTTKRNPGHALFCQIEENRDGSSAVGLTAYITKDPETRDLVLERYVTLKFPEKNSRMLCGALVLSDRGICCIDEFDKMTDYTRTVLHEVMEQQTISVAKAGIVCSLNARTAVLAAANPRQSRYIASLSVLANINLPPTLITRQRDVASLSVLANINLLPHESERICEENTETTCPPFSSFTSFDLIYLILDKPSETSDRQLARHLVSLFYEEPAPVCLRPNPFFKGSHNNFNVLTVRTIELHYLVVLREFLGSSSSYRPVRNVAGPSPDLKMDSPAHFGDKGPQTDLIPTDLLTDYISYARAKVFPVLTDEAVNELVACYGEMRKMGGANRNTVTATPRQLESIIRLSEAHARMRFSAKVEPLDVAEAKRLVKSALQQTATDPTTGAIDLQLLMTGRSGTEQQALKEIGIKITQWLSDHPATTVKCSELFEGLARQDPEMAPLMSQVRDALTMMVDEGTIGLSHGADPIIRRLVI